MKYNESIVVQYYKSCGLPVPRFEYQIIPDRKFRWDICFIGTEERVWVECQGGIWRRGCGAHNTGTALVRDYEKHNLATLAGWRGLYVLPAEVCLLSTVKMIKALLNQPMRHG